MFPLNARTPLAAEITGSDHARALSVIIVARAYRLGGCPTYRLNATLNALVEL